MKYLAITIIIFSYLSTYGQQNEFYNRSMIESIFADTLVNSDWYKDHIRNLVKLIDQDKGLPNKMFPFIRCDSVVAYKFNQKYRSTGNSNYIIDNVVNNGEIAKDIELEYGKKMTDDQVQKFLSIINNPMNFDWSECGTPITYGLIIFYKNEQIEAFVQLSCGYSQVACYPMNLRTKFGALRNSKVELLVDLAKEIEIE